MVEIGGMPILWHIMKGLGTHGITDFVICLGYKGDFIKQWFANYFLMTSDVTLDLANRSMEVHDSRTEPWKVTLLETGPTTLTGGRLKRAMRHIGIGVLAGALFNVFAVTNLSRWIAGGHGGYLYFDLSGIVLGVVGAALVLMARLVDQARALQAELDDIL